MMRSFAMSSMNNQEYTEKKKYNLTIRPRPNLPLGSTLEVEANPTSLPLASKAEEPNFCISMPLGPKLLHIIQLGYQILGFRKGTREDLGQLLL